MKRHQSDSSDSETTNKKTKMDPETNFSLSMEDAVLGSSTRATIEPSSSLLTNFNGFELPKEIVSSILDFQDVSTLQQTKLVCKTFYELSVLDKHYENSMIEEFPYYSRRLKYLNEFDNLMIKLFKRRFISKESDERLERLFWWIVEKSDKSDEKVREVIVDNGLLELMERIETFFYKLIDKLVEIGQENDMDAYEDDGGMYAICYIISRGEDYFNKVCAEPEIGAESEGYEDYMYPWNKRSYIPEEYSGNVTEEKVNEALSAGYEVFKIKKKSKYSL